MHHCKNIKEYPYFRDYPFTDMNFNSITIMACTECCSLQYHSSHTVHWCVDMALRLKQLKLSSGHCNFLDKVYKGVLDRCFSLNWKEGDVSYHSDWVSTQTCRLIGFCISIFQKNMYDTQVTQLLTGIKYCNTSRPSIQYNS